MLACLDALQAAVESIESDGQENLDPAPLISQLRALIRDRTPEAGGRARRRRRRSRCRLRSPQRVRPAAGSCTCSVKLDPEVMMPAVRAHMVFAALNDHGEMIGSIPAPDAIENFEGHEIDAWLVSRPRGGRARHRPRCASPTSPASRSTELARGRRRRRSRRSPTSRRADVAEDDAPVATEAPARPTGARSGWRRPVTAARTVRVDAERLDTLMHLMGELVIHRTAVEAYTASINSPELQHAVQNLTRSSQSLQSMVMQVRMIPVDVVFMRFPRLVRDLSTKLGKDIELDLVGRETELDRTVVDSLGDPLVHLVRNSLDHGIEPPDVRIAAGKPRTGTLTIAARHAGGSVVIEVRDDGRGVDPQAVARKAVERGPDRCRGRQPHRHEGRDRAAVRAWLLDRRDDQRHLRPRRRYGRGAREDPRARRRGPDGVGASARAPAPRSGCR